MKTNPLTKLAEIIEEETVGGSAIVLDQLTKTDVDTIPTGILEVDEITGIGGVPRGRMTEIYGNEGTGKTSFCLHMIAEANKKGISAGIVDSEHALSIKRMEIMGIDKSKVLLSQPDYGEQALEITEVMIRSGKLGIVIVDSVAALTPKAEIDKDMGEATMGSQARLMSQAMRKLVAVTAKENVALVFTNQIRSKLGTWGSPDVTTGGNALKFYCSLRLSLKRIGSLQDSKGSKLASRYKITVVKNKLAVPYRETEYCVGEKGIYILQKKGNKIAVVESTEDQTEQD